LEIAELRKDYISTVSHELRTPLSTIYGYLNILRSYPEEMLQKQEKTEMFVVMTDECHRLIRLIDNLLLSAQLEQEDFGQKLSLGPVSLDQVVSQALRQMDRGLKMKDVKVVKNIPPDLPPIHGNSDLLYQVFQNLIANSIKFSHKDPCVEIAGREEQEAVLVTLSDNGVGIEEKDLARIFNKFFRSNGQGNPQPGLGIGLYLVQELVHLHGGDISVSSRLNEGTTFSMRFPKYVR
jgi:signal transduction histidine kinase